MDNAIDNLIVETQYGKVQGTCVDGIGRWTGMPYAAAPTGEDRFMPPRDPKPWDGVREATQFGPLAMQPTGGGEVTVVDQDSMSEDCLSINVWSKLDEQEKKPVMVWIHGGGFTVGDAYKGGLYEGANYAKDGVVYVAFQYRLSVLGFLNLKEVSNGEFSYANVGLLDQIKALEWVRDNIAAFGGDPDNITVFGESAGAISIANLICMPAAQGLFHRGILHSFCHPVFDEELSLARTREFMDRLGIAPEDYRKLWEVPAGKLIEVVDTFPLMSFMPWVDGTLIPKDPFEAYESGDVFEIPLIAGNMRDEYMAFSMTIPYAIANSGKSESDYLEEVGAKRFGPMWRDLVDAYASNGMENLDVDTFSTMCTDTSFAFATLKAARYLSEKMPVWQFRFDVNDPTGMILPGKAYHGIELAYVFENYAASGIMHIVPGTEKTAKAIHDSWVNFAKSGTPGAPWGVEWPPYDSEGKACLVFENEGASLEHGPSVRLAASYQIVDEAGFHPELIQ